MLVFYTSNFDLMGGPPLLTDSQTWHLQPQHPLLPLCFAVADPRGIVDHITVEDLRWGINTDPLLRDRGPRSPMRLAELCMRPLQGTARYVQPGTIVSLTLRNNLAGYRSRFTLALIGARGE